MLKNAYISKVSKCLYHMLQTLRILMIISCVLIQVNVYAVSNDDTWIDTIRADHPRLFFNAETWSQVKARALDQEKEWFLNLKKRVDGYPENPTSESTRDDFAYSKNTDGTYDTVKRPRPSEWGSQAAHTAFVYLVSGEKRYLEQAKKMLEVSVEAYHQCYERGMTVNWYSTSRVHWLAAWDWLYNDMEPDTRWELMSSFLRHIDSVRPRPDRKPIYRLNDSDHTTGFYGDRNLVWFTGLAAHGAGFSDDTTKELLRIGYRYNMDMFAYRAKCAGDDGGLASASTNYSMGAYPWSQFNFLYTWRSATGEDIAADWPHLAYFPVWIMWNWLPGQYPRGFGTGDTYHYDNALRVRYLYTHMSQIMDFYAESHPQCASLAAYIREILPEEARTYNRTYAFYPFLLTKSGSVQPPDKPQDADLHARHFETLGQVFMRSGTGPDDTYCLFTIGSQVPSHKQHDENNFVIYKKGYLALDTGTRGAETGYQLRHYYSQTVAHNCMLIHMPDEPFPGYWGKQYEGPEGQISCGGTYKTTGGTCRAFEANDHYVYVAGDATPCYLPDKCELALRQYVFVMPNHFVICDRVTSTDAGFKKDWLLHTQNEPDIDGMQFHADHEEGRLFCRTLYPKNAVISKVGGPGKEFYACGKNWELAPEIAKRVKERYNGGLLGNWRIEVSPGLESKEDVFLHLIEVGDKGLTEMTPSALIDRDGRKGVRFNAGKKDIEVIFGTSGKPSGHITVRSDDGILIDKDLIDHVTQQSGLSGVN